MILVDTNVLSEIMKAAPDRMVVGWMDRQPARTLFLSSVTLGELLFGVRLLPVGKRRNELVVALDGIRKDFDRRILPFDTRAAETYADLAIRARAAGRGFPLPDGYIAAIAAAQGFAVASRDASAFAAVGLTVINPWTDA
jgi:predicted nucleic acid-binding protein